MRFLLHSVFPPETCLLPPQCWATRILKHWDHCDTQINIGEGEIDTSVSRFLTSIVDLPRWLLSRYFMKRASLEAPFLLYRDWTHCAWAVCYPLSGFSLGSFGGPPGKRDYYRDPGITILGSQLTGLARLSHNCKVDFWCVLTKVPRSLLKASQPGSCNRGVHAHSCIMGNQGKGEKLEDLY